MPNLEVFCAPGDGRASRASLIAALGSAQFTMSRSRGTATVVRWLWFGQAEMNLSCWQLERTQAIYKPHWDNGQIIARACR